ncbi:SGNH/GDSL hydrolase family protein [Amnibacterium setariae]|uniref:Lipase n=1 Tax=Amnibacterium setariae TaxID=2306585 RepID=A0A3A1TXS2_9MICO|nr:SGNH/GDSL hydrolase family protein [Amnibacterium setariae]RIX28570.1 lipase [Amnibacterium setariae]
MIHATDLRPFLSEVAEVERTPRGQRPHRLPAPIRRRFPDPQLLAMEAQPSGVRLTFRTTATRVALTVIASRLGFAGIDRPRGRIDLTVDDVFAGSSVLTGGDLTETDLRTGSTTVRPGDAHRAAFEDLPARDKTVELWLPHNESVELVRLQADAELRPVHDDRPLWLHHGSSISHGSNAVGPTAIWPAVASRAAGHRLRNLGFGGSALLDPFVARTMRDLPADVISLKVGINIVNLDVMRRRAFTAALHGFLDTIRDGHPSTPLLVVTPIFCGIHEDTPGPGAIDPASLQTGAARFIATGAPGDTALGRLTLRVVREAIGEVLEHRDDPALHLVDGLRLYGREDAERIPLPDGLHPDTDGHALIGGRFAPRLREHGRTRAN